VYSGVIFMSIVDEICRTAFGLYYLLIVISKFIKKNALVNQHFVKPFFYFAEKVFPFVKIGL